MHFLFFESPFLFTLLCCYLNLHRKYEYENFLCTLLLSGNDHRAFIFAVRAFNVEIALIRDQVSQRDIGLGRLAFWRDAVNKIFRRGESSLKEDVPRHPVVLELNRVKDVIGVT